MHQVLKFYFFAAIATFVNLISRFIFSEMLSFQFMIAVTVAYLLGLIVNFGLNKKYTFTSSSRKTYQEFRTFFVVAIIGLLLTNIFAVMVLSGLNIIFPDLDAMAVESLAHAAAVAVVSIYSFLAHKYFTFRKGIRTGIYGYYKKQSSASTVSK